MKLAERLITTLAKHGGLFSDGDGQVAASLAVEVGEKEVPQVTIALTELRKAGFLTWGNKNVELTEEGRTVARKLAESEFGFEPVKAEKVHELPKSGRRRSYGEKVVRAFLDSEQDAAKVTGLAKSASSVITSVNTYLKKAGLRGKILARVHAGELYLARKDVADLDAEAS